MLVKAMPILLWFVVTSVLLGTSASAGGIELWEGESATVNTASSIAKSQIVRGSVAAKSDKPGVATAGKVTGDNGTFTVTGVKEGEATIKVTGKRVHYNGGTNNRSLQTEVPFESYIDVTVKKREEDVKILELKRREKRTINYPKKKLKMVSGTLKNSNRKVCGVRFNNIRKLTITGKKKGECKITVQLIKTMKNGKTKRILGVIYVTVVEERIKQKDNHMSMGWGDMFIGRIVILNGPQPAPLTEEDKKKLKDALEKENEDQSSYILPPDGTEYVSVGGGQSEYCTYNPSADPVPVGDSTPVAISTGQPGGGEDSVGGEEEGYAHPEGLVAVAAALKDDEEEEEEKTPPAWTAAVKAEATVVEGGQLTSKPLAGASVKLNLGEDPAVARGSDVGFDQDPLSGVTGADGVWSVSLTGEEVAAYGLADVAAKNPSHEQKLDLTSMGGALVHMSANPKKALHPKLLPYLRTVIPLKGNAVAVLSYPKHYSSRINALIKQSESVVHVEEDSCRIKEDLPNDPFFRSKNSWKQKYDDQWALKHVGFASDKGSPWKAVEGKAPVVVAVIDTGLDWNHLDFSWDNIWQNPGDVPDNGKDDDGNGFVDDVIGWNFVQDTPKPWDRDGHGTLIAGVIAATSNNDAGIAGMNPNARIMVLKALNDFGQTRVSFLTQAILYAADNGAQVINLSVGGENRTRTEQEAIDYALSKGVVVVVAAGNKGADMSGYGPAGLDGVITVAASDLEDKRPSFSNWGAGIDIAAPGVDVLSLRARRTDLMRDIPGVEYEPGRAYVGKDKRYYRAAGTSFAAPFVSGAASLLLSVDPKLTPAQVKRMLMQSARDIEVPGIDQYTGYGVLDVRAALAADSNFEVIARIDGVEVVRKDGAVFVQVKGSADANDWKDAWLEIGAGETPSAWKKVGESLAKPVRGNVLGTLSAEEFRGAALWMVRVVVEHKDGTRREMRFQINLG